MKLASMISGGKDSLYSMYLEKKEGHSIEVVLSVVTKSDESYMFHFPNSHLTKTISSLMETKMLFATTKGEKEKELDDLKELLKKAKKFYKIDGITTGATASNYQKTRIDKICKDLSLESLAPIWQKDPAQTLRDMLDAGFSIMIVRVAAPPLDRKWLGRVIDEDTVKELEELNRKHGIHILGEGGEYESLVLDCPLYSKQISISGKEIIWDSKERSGTLFVKKYELVDKPDR